MKKIFAFIVVATLFAVSCNFHGDREVIRVGMLDGIGSGDINMPEAFAACALDPVIKARYITTADIALGVLDSLDVLIFPGGAGSAHTFSLGETNTQKVKEFARNGGGILAICAGGYALSHTPDYACIAMNGASVYDLDHSSRGQGRVAVKLTPGGEAIFPELKGLDTLYLLYENGPLLEPAESSRLGDATPYTPFVEMISDVYGMGGGESGASPGKPFILGNNYGKGRICTSIGHPESTAGMMWMIPRLIRWCAGKNYISYPNSLCNPSLSQGEKILTEEDLNKEASLYRTFVYGTADEKIEGIKWMKDNPSWSMKKWVASLLFDKDAKVRMAAAEYIAENQVIRWRNYVKGALKAEKDSLAKREIMAVDEYLDGLFL